MSVLPILRSEKYAGRVACYLIRNHGVYANGTDMTDGRTSDCYIALSDIDTVSVIRAGNGITQHVESASEGPLGSAIFVLIYF